jgi:DNA adenine methylase
MTDTVNDRKESLEKDNASRRFDGLHIQKPFLKWVGGKTQIIQDLINEFPSEINNYHEIFLGGGSVLLAFLSLVKQKKIILHGQVFAYDLNEALISLYKAIQTNPISLYKEVVHFVDEYKKCNQEPLQHKRAGADRAFNKRKPSTIEEARYCHESYYYWIRKSYNNMSSIDKNTLKGSAMFLFLNKTCFRGLYREGPQGFNVPFGNYKNPEIMNKEQLLEIHHLIKDVVFTCQDFSQSLRNVSQNDFVYLDPPYAPINEHSFVSYTSMGFSKEQHMDLFTTCKALTRKQVMMVLSNADVTMVSDFFLNESDQEELTFYLKQITCKRSINSKKPGSKSKELIIRNFVCEK